jgi:hypothetical protein
VVGFTMSKCPDPRGTTHFPSMRILSKVFMAESLRRP